MRAVIIAAGEGSRLSDHTDGIPKLFLELDGRTLYDRQLASLESVCDHVTVVLGYGFVGESTDHNHDRPESPSTGVFDGEIRVVETSVDREVDREKIGRLLATDRELTVDAVVVPHWDRVENAESCRHGLRAATGDALVLNGDIVYGDAIIETVVNHYATTVSERGRSLVAVKEGIQNEMTAVRWNSEGRITAYGAIEGHQVAGIFVVNDQHLDRACEVLAARPDDWFPVIFPVIESTYVPIPDGDHFEINTPAHLAAAKRGL